MLCDDENERPDADACLRAQVLETPAIRTAIGRTRKKLQLANIPPVSQKGGDYYSGHVVPAC